MTTTNNLKVGDRVVYHRRPYTIAGLTQFSADLVDDDGNERRAMPRDELVPVVPAPKNAPPPIVQLPEEPPPPASPAAPEFPCPDCDFQADNNRNLGRHLRRRGGLLEREVRGAERGPGTGPGHQREQG